MKGSAILLCCLIVVANAAYNPDKNESPIWKVFCDNLYGGRVDTIVNPGTYSAHVHRVFGGNNFSPATASRTPVEQYNVAYQSPCTTCSIKTVDNSMYWTADLYYKNPDNTYSLVPSAGLTVYYLSRGGSTGTQRTNPNWQPIPKGLRIVAGSPMRRTYNASLVAHQAINYVCLNYNGDGWEENDWNKLKTTQCPNGLRTQVWFPMCWDGKNLDSPDHFSHMSYPIQRKDGGDCPTTHPVRIPGVFFEHLYNIKDFPHGNGENNFLWSMGDNTGFGHHGDFLSGWDEKVMAAAIADPRCSNENPDMAFGNNVRACPPLAQFVKNNTEPKCLGLNKPVPLTEDLGYTKPLTRIPGCYGINGLIAGCDKTPAGSDNDGSFFIKSKLNGNYATAKKAGLVTVSHNGQGKSYSEVWSFGSAPNGQVTIQNGDHFDYISARDQAQMMGGADTWEYFTIEPQNGNSKIVAIRSARYTNPVRYATVGADGYITFVANSTITDARTFIIEDNNGGYVPAEDGHSQLTATPTALNPNANLVEKASSAVKVAGSVLLVALMMML